MAEKTVAEKLQVKPGRRVRFINAPDRLAELLGNLPEGAEVLDHSADINLLLPVDILILFAQGFNDLQNHLSGLRAAVAPGGIIWVAYHKGTSRIKTDIHRDSINTYAASVGLQGVAIISVDEDWAALRLKVV